MKADVNKLIAARDLVSRHGGWTQRWYARDDAGNRIDSDSEVFFTGAVCCCAVGALAIASRNTPMVVECGLEIEVLASVIDLDDSHDVIAWNDHPYRTQDEVVAAFDRAIELARAAS